MVFAGFVLLLIFGAFAGLAYYDQWTLINKLTTHGAAILAGGAGGYGLRVIYVERKERVE